jgi:hypothetical protein
MNMRRIFLTLTFISFAGWSQAQPQAQPPRAPNLSTNPSPNPWVQFGSLAPGIITALTALAAVWLTQRHQLRLEIAKAEIAAKYKSQDRRWEFRKELHVALNRSTVDVLLTQTKLLQYARLRNLESEAVRDDALQNILLIQDELNLKARAFWSCVCLAPLATAEGVYPIVASAYKEMESPIDWNANPEKQLQRHIDAINHCLKALQTAGRKDLWGESEPEAKN